MQLNDPQAVVMSVSRGRSVIFNGTWASVEQMNLTSLQTGQEHSLCSWLQHEEVYITHVALVKGVTLHLIAVPCSEMVSFVWYFKALEKTLVCVAYHRYSLMEGLCYFMHAYISSRCFLWRVKSLILVSAPLMSGCCISLLWSASGNAVLSDKRHSEWVLSVQWVWWIAGQLPDVCTETMKQCTWFFHNDRPASFMPRSLTCYATDSGPCCEIQNLPFVKNQ